MIKIAPSILSADFSKLEEEISMVEKAGAHYLHIDVMDGHFVPNITIGSCVVKSIRKCSELVFDVHLMIDDPDKYIPDFVKAGADIITFHYEAAEDVKKTISLIKSLGVKAGISVKPETDVKEILPYIDNVDMVLIMTVNPGFGGQTMIKEALNKAKFLREKYPELDIQADGGINTSTYKEVIDSGVNILVAGSAVFNAQNPAEVVKILRG